MFAKMKKSFLTWLESQGYYAFVHNKNVIAEGKEGQRIYGAMIVEGSARAISETRKLKTLGIFWSFKSDLYLIQLSVNKEEGEVVFTVAIPPGYVAFTVGHDSIYHWNLGNKYKILSECYERVTGISIHHDSIYWDVWRDDLGSDRGWPWWVTGSFGLNEIKEVLFGPESFSKEEYNRERVEVPMPEKSYPGEIVYTVDTWKRSRWPFPRRRTRANLKFDEPIPEPGKGENPWDIDDDALYELSTSKTRAHEVVGMAVSSVLRRRWRYGGKDWKPEIRRDRTSLN